MYRFDKQLTLGKHHEKPLFLTIFFPVPSLSVKLHLVEAYINDIYLNLMKSWY